ncbi:hypothetical protein KDK95_10370 [Actinospica sp. MGRD01-02]|uniref:Uncharacterized protein n=1 Tax=Actinospica acidithermotolerans TaxID=2828514 RepID=A0A941IJ19_9ACTN|nr:hypothetical protein [Actinospica acidithermotolerans]MBR7826708.1 hypothetical protein [Actinospica acidithermotolerans]
MPVALQLPTPPSPQQVVVYLALHLGVPALLVGIVVWLLGLQGVAKSWAEAARSGRELTEAIRRTIGERKRAAALLAVYSALVVALSYTMALLINALVIIYRTNQNGITSWRAVESIMSSATWPPAASWTVGTEAAVIVIYLVAIGVGMGFVRGLITFTLFLAAFACAVATLGMLFDLLGDWMTPAGQSLGNNREALIQTQIFIAAVCVALVPLLIGITTAADHAIKPARPQYR